MLKPRFRNKAQMLKEFWDSLRYMDQDNPKDTTILPKAEPKVATKPLTEAAPAPKAPVQAEAAPLSRYSSASKALTSFRVLAGLEEREISPWNPGILGETRTVKKMQEDFGMETSTKKEKK